MAEHRRVEPRSIMGSGMSTDPERVREVEEEAERKARLWRERGEASFGDVLKTAPARADLDEDAPERRGARKGAPAPDDVETADGGGATEAADAPGKAAPKAPPPDAPKGPRAPPDPRAQALHKALDRALSESARKLKNAPAPIAGVSGETPPTGSVKNAPAAKKKGTP